MEHTHPIDREFSWGGAVLALALLAVIAISILGGWALIDSFGGTSSTAATGGTGQNASAGQARPRSATSVLVLNGNGRAGVAGHLANRMLRKGYREAQATNAPVTTYARSLILYRPGWQSEAARLAKDAHVGAIAPVDGKLPAGDGRFSLVLIVGR